MSGFRYLLVAALLASALVPISARAGGPAPAVRLLVSPACIAVGQKIALTITLTGVRPGERVAFSGHPARAGFGGGDLGFHTANAAGAIFFTYPAPTMFNREAGVWIVSAYRHSGPPPYTRPGSVWLAASASFSVAPRAHSCRPSPAATSSPAPTQILARYFAALNARHYYAAWQLEAPCGIGFSTSNGPGAPRGWEGWQGRGPWQPPSPQAAAHPILASARVTGIRRLDIPILTRHHILAFGVSGYFTFDYSRVPWANMKHKNGFHVIKIAVWQCQGRWGIEPGVWLTGSGGELTWT